ncbi:IucA/IucC family protein [Streptomyces physcomitrii]
MSGRPGAAPQAAPGVPAPAAPYPREAAEPDAQERELLLRVLSALLREDVVGMRGRSRYEERADGGWLRRPLPDGSALALAVEAEGFQHPYAARLPRLVHEPAGRQLTTVADVLAALGALADPADREGFGHFAEECREALAAMRLHARTAEWAEQALTERHGPAPARWSGLRGGLGFESLAARLDHPVHPASRARSGLGEDELRSYAPEFQPRFALRWLALPREAVTVPGTAERLPESWPTPARLGLPRLEGSHLMLPVHPLTWGAPLAGALRERGLADAAVLAERAHLEVAPTLSLRTVASLRDPALHLKLPLATATLGRRNRRTIKPGTLADGATVQRLLAEVLAREPRYAPAILHADERVYAHAGHELLAVLCRRQPPGLDRSVVVPLAALLGPAPGGALVAEHLADRFYGGELLALFDDLWRLLLGYQSMLLGYGIALESHQQNISLVLDEESGGTRLRLLFKDDDGPRINLTRLRARLGRQAPRASDFADPRICAEHDKPVLDVFTTITLHLCAGAYAFALARLGRAPLPELLGLVRTRLEEAASQLGTGQGQSGALLREYVLDAPHLPVKAMVSAGTLLSKERSGAADINKHYTTGPNYLSPTGALR